MSIRTWGKARNLKGAEFEEADTETLVATVNAWLVSREEEEILDIVWRLPIHGTPGVEHPHCFITYTEE